MNLSTKQSEINEMTNQLEKFSALVDLYNNGQVDKGMFLSELARFEKIDWTKENMLNQLFAYNALGAAYGNLKSKSLDYTKAYYDNEYVYKEISYYHNLHYVVSRVTKEAWAALYWTAFRLSCRVNLRLANAYDHLGRFCEAQQNYRQAAQDDKNRVEVEINQGYAYANMHSFWTEEEPWIVRRAQQLMQKHEKKFKAIAPELMSRVCGWVVPSFDVPAADFEGMKDGVYEKWVNENFLRVNRYCDVEPFSQLSLTDNVKMPSVRDTKERRQLFESSFAEVKRTFVETRKLMFTAIGGEGEVNVELIKMTYKNFYSILDKIAVFLQAYLNLPIKVHQVDYSSIWTDKKGVIRQEFLAKSQNLSLLALYNVKLDVYGSKTFDYVMDEQTKDIQRIRNFIEHKMVVVRDGGMEWNDYQLKISKFELALNTIRLAQLVRCAIIYLCNFVMHAEYDKHQQ
jgi:hypothetical protein